MLPFSWEFLCNKNQWMTNLFGKKSIDNDMIWVKKFLCFVLVILKEPKQTRTVGARADIHHETPLTVLLGCTLYRDNSVFFKGIALFQPHQLFGLMFIIFIVCFVTSEGIFTSIVLSLLISIVHGIAITLDCKSTLPKVKRLIEHIIAQVNHKTEDGSPL